MSMSQLETYLQYLVWITELSAVPLISLFIMGTNCPVSKSSKVRVTPTGKN